jgi:type IV pilus assembly protein PilV
VKVKNFKATPDRLLHQAGFAMIEVLASLLILTVGLLSVAGLSANSLKASDTSAHRASAAREVLAIADAIRSNRQAAVDGQFDVTLSGQGPSSGAIGNSISQWKQALARIPGGKGSILFVEAKDTVIITAEWSEDRIGGPPPSYVLELRI